MNISCLNIHIFVLSNFVEIYSGSYWNHLVTYQKIPSLVIFIFAREQKCINNHFGMGFCAEMVVTNTFFAFEKILNQCFFPYKLLHFLK